MNKIEKIQKVTEIFNQHELIAIANRLSDAAKFNEGIECKGLAEQCKSFEAIFRAAYYLNEME